MEADVMAYDDVDFRPAAIVSDQQQTRPVVIVSDHRPHREN